SANDHEPRRHCQRRISARTRPTPSRTAASQCVERYSVSWFMTVATNHSPLSPLWERGGRVSELDPLHAMVLAVQDVDAALAIHSQPPRVAQFPRLMPVAAPAAERLPLRRELLHAVVALLQDIQAGIRPGRKRQVIRIRQLPRFTPRRAPGANEFPVARENPNAVLAGVGAAPGAVGPQRPAPNASA